ncbi:ZIP zinc transporter [Nitzschia inconspicua]|uniref:ZIP zinc transporter n=1 Tax=Nitzschia inconspicua TaxID=303405 RepID=A0A9K3QAH5_9STRA|nr:ZIP zinc transporter [Nitzschia inconspicua]
MFLLSNLRTTIVVAFALVAIAPAVRVTATEPFSSLRHGNNGVFRSDAFPIPVRALEGESDSDCHCDGTTVHCSNKVEEEFCSCAGGVLTCTDPFEGCHCDGPVAHCNNDDVESACSCENRIVQCEVSMIQFDARSGRDKPWGSVIVATLTVNLVTLIGVVFIAGEWLRKLFCPSWVSKGKQHVLWTHVLIPMFACGALLATTFFLVLPEGLLLIQSDFGGDGHDGHNHRRFLQEEDDHSEEAAATWRFGAAILGGFLVPVVSHIIFHQDDLHTCVVDNLMESDVKREISDDPARDQGKNVSNVNSDALAEGESTFGLKSDEKSTDSCEKETAVSSEVAPIKGVRLTNPSLTASLFLGDFFHNFSDGVFIGAAFLLCDRNLALAITAATIYHELAQEVADYFVLVHNCGMTRIGALALNFLCGLSIMAGGILVLAADLTNTAIGVILCVGGGVYIHVAVAECLTTARTYQEGRKQQAYGILAFIVGVVPIGLVLLNHQHC